MTTFPTSRVLRALGVVVPALAAAGISFSAGAPEQGPARRATALAVVDAADAARVIVKYRADAGLMRPLATGAAVRPLHADALSTRLGLTLHDGRQIGDRAQVVHGQGLSSQALAERLAAQPDVEYAVVDQRMQLLAAPNDPLYPAGQTGTVPAVGQWYLRAPTSSTIVDATTVVSSINAEAAWNITTGSASVVVADLDTGVRRDHPDLTSKLLAGYDFVADVTTANDSDGRDADPSDPGDSTVASDPSSWHGTQTAGLIGAATNNGTGMASIGRDVMLLPVRVLGKGGGYESDVVAAMLWAAGLTSSPVVNPNPAKVINLSLGATPTNGVPAACSSSYADTVRQVNAAGVVVVAAAGNDGLGVGSPANCGGVIAVGGVRHAGTKVGYSDLGPQIAISAPAGNCVTSTGSCLYPLLTTSNSGTTTPVSNAAGGSIYTGSGSNASLGTSFSAPLVSGTVGLMYSANPTLTPAQVLAALRSTARAFPTSNAGTSVAACTAPTTTAQGGECYCTTSTCGAGLLDAGAAVAAVATATSAITVASTSVVNGDTISVSGVNSRSSGLNASITTYQWTITAGSTLATFTSATNAATATLQTKGPGTVTVSLAVTDSAGARAISSVNVTVRPATATITTPTVTPTTGSVTTLDGSTSNASSTAATIVSYQWSITSGTSNATLVGATNASTVSLQPVATGSVVVSLTITDSTGAQATSAVTLNVVAATETESGGGGAMELDWLLAALLAVIAVGAVTPRRRGRRVD